VNNGRRALPWFPFFANDWLASTAEMPLRVKGAYIDLLTTCWNLDGLEPDWNQIGTHFGPKRARQLRRIWPLLETKFPIAPDGKRRNPKLEGIREKQQRRQRVRQNAARARWAHAHES
jgi:hypothetical protein